MNLLTFLMIWSCITISAVICSALKLRIAYGVEAKRVDFPFMARILASSNEKASGCGGALISDRHVLTAAHCLFECESKECYDRIHVILGDVNKKIREVKDKNRKIYFVPRKNVIIHKNYYVNSEFSVNDIAIIPLPELVKFNDYIKPAKLPRYDENFHDKSVQIAGWGQTQDDSFPDVLMRTKVKIVKDKICHKFDNYQKGKVLCAQGNGRACIRDSGSPYVITKEKGSGLKKEISWTIVGINIWVFSPCASPTPQVMTNVQYYLDWIYSKTKIEKRH